MKISGKRLNYLLNYGKNFYPNSRKRLKKEIRVYGGISKSTAKANRKKLKRLLLKDVEEVLLDPSNP